MRGELICCENFLARTDAWRHILEPDPQQQRVLGHLKDAVVILGKDDDMVSGVLQELSSPVLPASRPGPGRG